MSKASARDRLEQALARIADPAGEGKRACLTVYADAARAAADAADARAKAGKPLGPLDGAIVSIKDLFDVAGEVTRAGSRVLADEGLVAAADAPVVQRLRAAGAVIVAKTNMSEFAFSGVGANPHYGTPGNPFDRTRAPGGSTSGGAVAVADGMCEIAIGTDTGGSTRIPAALCGIVGWKPSKQRVPTDGAFPLSFTLDSIGPMAKSVADCALADAVMAGEAAPTLEPAPLAGLRLGIWQGMPFEGVDDTVVGGLVGGGRAARPGRRALQRRDDLAGRRHGRRSTPRAASRRPRPLRSIASGSSSAAPASIRTSACASSAAAPCRRPTTSRWRRRAGGWCGRWTRGWRELDALVLPTTPIVAPTLAEVAESDEFGRKNALLLRNTNPVNFFDLCAISLPLPRQGGLPTGLMLVGRNGQDRRLFDIAAAVEKLP